VQETIELQKRITALSNEELGRMLILQAGDYLPEAIDIARQEMAKRSLTMDSLKTIIANPPPSLQPEQSQTEKTPRIRGWLVLPTIGFIINPFLILQDLGDTLRLNIDRSIVLFGGAVDVVMIAFCCIVAWQLFRKKRNTPFLAITFYLGSFILTLLYGVIISHSQTISGFSVLGYVELPLIACIIWVPYFLLSKRVKRTFVVN
jgi:hypothetical protein